MSRKIIGVTVGTSIAPSRSAKEAGAVLYETQALTEDQKAQARQNIGAAAEGSGGSGGGSSVQSDWNQTDDTEADFIKNKTHGFTLEQVIPESEYVGEEEDGMFCIYLDPSGFTGLEEYLIITMDGVTYNCNARKDLGIPMFGNLKIYGLEDTGEPFALMLAVSMQAVALIVDDAKPHTVSIAKRNVQKLDSKYYNASIVYYAGQQSGHHEYVFYDPGESQAVTRADLIKDASNYPIIITLGGTIYFQPTYVAPYSGGDLGFGTIVISNEDTFYTAEYVPET